MGKHGKKYVEVSKKVDRGKGYDFAEALKTALDMSYASFDESIDIAVRLGVDSERDLEELSLEELRSFSEVIEADVFDVLAVEGSVAARDHIGGTAPAQVRKAVARARKRLKSEAP